MTIEEIKAKEDITVDELQQEIDKREEWIFYALMADTLDPRIAETRRVINKLKQMMGNL